MIYFINIIYFVWVNDVTNPPKFNKSCLGKKCLVQIPVPSKHINITYIYSYLFQPIHLYYEFSNIQS